MKIKFLMTGFFFSFLAPLFAEGEKVATTATQGGGGAAASGINWIINLFAQVGNLFGDATGIRIGGTTGTAIIALIIAKVLGDNVPSWVKGLLYIGGGTMAAGSGANIIQTIQQFIR